MKAATQTPAWNPKEAEAQELAKHQRSIALKRTPKNTREKTQNPGRPTQERNSPKDRTLCTQQKVRKEEQEKQPQMSNAVEQASPKRNRPTQDLTRAQAMVEEKAQKST